MELMLETTRIAKHAVIKVVGELDLYTTPAMSSVLQRLILHGETYLAVDLSACTYCDSEGFKVLMRTAMTVEKSGYIVLCGANSTVLRCINRLGIAALFTILPSTEHLYSLADRERDIPGASTGCS